MENENCSKNKGANRAVEVTEISLIFQNKMPSLGTYFKFNSIEIMQKEEQAWMVP